MIHLHLWWWREGAMVMVQAARAFQGSNTLFRGPLIWRITQHRLHRLCLFPHNISFYDCYSVLQQQHVFHSSIVVRTISTSSQPTSHSSAKGGNARIKLLGANSGSPTIRTRILRGGPAAWTMAALLSIAGVSLTAYALSERKTFPKVTDQAPKHASPSGKEGQRITKTGIGGPFRLINQEGKIVSDKDFAGKWPLIYFGYTHCPDDCPRELQKMAHAIENIEAQIGDKVVPVFVSIDPERDNVSQMRAYLREFSPKIMGLTGGVKDTRQMAQEYRVFYKKTEEEDGDYLVDHSNNMYLMNPQMEYDMSFGQEYSPEALAAGVVQEIQQVNEREASSTEAN